MVDLLVDARLRLEDHVSLVRGSQLRDVPDALSVPFPERHGHASPQGLVDLVRGDERARGEAGGEVWREARQPRGHEYALQPALCVDEALGSVYQHPALRDQSSVLVVDLAIAPVGLGGHLLEKAAAAECGLKAEPFCLLDNDGNPCLCIGKEDYIGVVDLDELQEVCEDDLLRPLEPLLALIEDLDTGDIPGKVWISGYLHSHDA